MARHFYTGARALIVVGLLQACWCGADGPPRPPRPAPSTAASVAVAGD